MLWKWWALGTHSSTDPHPGVISHQCSAMGSEEVRLSRGDRRGGEGYAQHTLQLNGTGLWMV